MQLIDLINKNLLTPQQIVITTLLNIKYHTSYYIYTNEVILKNDESFWHNNKYIWNTEHENNGSRTAYAYPIHELKNHGIL